MFEKLSRALLGLNDAPARTTASLASIRQHWDALRNASADQLKQPRQDLAATFAAACVAAERVLKQTMFDEQLLGALALTEGCIAEMQTGEGKTLAAVPAAAWLAREHKGVHVMTVNDYLARRDAHWMGPVYTALGLTTGFINQAMTSDERRAAYACDITYATANECGFDLLRDQLCLYRRDQVLRPFANAVIDEADSILIDEARIPLVIAGGNPSSGHELAWRSDDLVRRFRRHEHYRVDEFGRNISLTDSGIQITEQRFHCPNLFDPSGLNILSAVTDALHAHVFLRRDVDYIVKDGVIESVDEFKGRVAKDRRWPAGLHTAIEAKERVALKTEGTILGSLTLQNLIALYPQVCGMTGTAATQAKEFQEMYDLEVRVIPTHKPVIRIDAPDRLFRAKHEKEQALAAEIARIHATGQPVLVGTASVAESERLSSRLSSGIRHEVLNARHDEVEAAIIAKAGQRGAVTISTNMAGRGTDIQLAPGVASLGGLHVIGTNKHESRRIDNQLRGRAGRQGDPGSSQFFVSLEDDLIVRFGEGMGGDVEAIQRVAEGQNLNIRLFLWKYESVVEGQRQTWQKRRQETLVNEELDELERLVRLHVMDELWSGYLAANAELRQGVHWVSWGGRDPLHEYLTSVDVLFGEMEDSLEDLVAERLAQAREGRIDPTDRGATWTYLTTDNPFGTWTERIVRGMRRKAQSGKFWG
jgi:preprotein translocase subunit SecA